MKKHLTLFIALVICGVLAPDLLFATSSSGNLFPYSDLLCNLTKVNGEWPKQQDAIQVLQNTAIYPCTNYHDWIQMHLMLTEKLLRTRNTNQLTSAQQKNRAHLLDELHSYWVKGIFPINDYVSYKTPVFIDRSGTHCAVGYLMMKSGKNDLAMLIDKEQKFAYVKDIKVVGVADWANKNGFTPDELALIQPTYSNPCIYFNCAAGTQHNVSCAGGQDGCFSPTISGLICPCSYSGIVPGIDTINFQAPINGGSDCDLTAGNYTLQIIDANGNAHYFIYTITQPDSVKLMAMITNPTCYNSSNGAIVINVSGGTPPYAYVWSDSLTDSIATGLAKGNYSLTVSDINAPAPNSNASSYACSAMATVTLVSPALITFGVPSVTNISCFGDDNGKIQLLISGGNMPYHYVWSNSDTTSGLTNVPVGAYSVRATDGTGCNTTDTINITQPPQLTITTTANNSADVNCDAVITINVAGGTPGYTYYCDDSITSTPVIYNLCPGPHVAIVTDANGCSASDTINIEPVNGIAETVKDNLTIMPNPVEDYLLIKNLFSGTYYVRVYDVTGKELFIFSNTPLINTTILSAGAYVLNVTDNTQVYNTCFIKR